MTNNGNKSEIDSLRSQLTERLEAETENPILLSFAGNNPNPLLRISRSGVILYANNASLPLLETWDCRVNQKLPKTYAGKLEQVFCNGNGLTLELTCNNQRSFSLLVFPVPEEDYANVYCFDNTDRRRIDKELAESRNRYRVLAERNPHGIQAIDPTGIITYVNPAYQEMLGYAKEELLGKHICDLLEPASKRAELREYVSLVVKEQPEPTPYFQKNRRKDGRIIDQEVTWNYHLDVEGNVIGFISVITDITQSKLAEEALNASQLKIERQLAEIKSIYNNVPVGICLFDTDCRYVRINDTLAAINGRPSSEHIGKTTAEVIPDLGGFTATILRQVIESGRPSFDVEVEAATHADSGIPHYWSTSWIPLKSQSGSVEYVIVVVQDLTDKKAAESLLKEAKEQAEASNIAKGRFLAQMSHEIRTPISVILSSVDLMDMNELGDEYESERDIIKRSGKSLLRLLNDILDYSKMEEGNVSINSTCFALKIVLNEIECSMRPLAESKNLEFLVVGRDSLPSTIHSDSGRISQCLRNLIDNAIKFTETGHVHLRASLENRDDKPFIRFVVEDSGIGIAPDMQQIVFGRFTQVGEEGTSRPTGAGLGLAITKQLAQLLGGELSLTSEKGKGSLFSLMVPVGTGVSAQDEQARKSAAESTGSQTPRFSGKVLMVDDYEDIRIVFGRILEGLGLEVMLASGGDEAIEAIAKQSFDLVLMDMEMPGTNGYEATRKLREKGITVPIVALTAHAMKDDEGECMAAGCDEYLAKPFDLDDLIAIVKKHIN